MSPTDKFWLVNLKLYEEDEKGKIVKSKETHLVDAPDVVGVESKIKEMMDGETREWTIQSISRSPIIEVY